MTTQVIKQETNNTFCSERVSVDEGAFLGSVSTTMKQVSHMESLLVTLSHMFFFIYYIIPYQIPLPLHMYLFIYFLKDQQTVLFYFLKSFYD